MMKNQLLMMLYQNMMNTNTNVKINNAKKSSKTNIPSNKKK